MVHSMTAMYPGPVGAKQAQIIIPPRPCLKADMTYEVY